MTSRPPSQPNNPNPPPFAGPSPRRLRKYQSHQALSSNYSSSSSSQQHPTLTPNGAVRARDSISAPNEQLQNSNNNAPGESSASRPRLRRVRSNSDAGSTKSSTVAPSTVSTTTTATATTATKPRRPPRKTGSSGFPIKRSNLETLLREGPAEGKIAEALQELRLLVLSTRVDADSDGMVRSLTHCIRELIFNTY